MGEVLVIEEKWLVDTRGYFLSAYNWDDQETSLLAPADGSTNPFTKDRGLHPDKLPILETQMEPKPETIVKLFKIHKDLAQLLEMEQQKHSASLPENTNRHLRVGAKKVIIKGEPSKEASASEPGQ